MLLDMYLTVTPEETRAAALRLTEIAADLGALDDLPEVLEMIGYSPAK